MKAWAVIQTQASNILPRLERDSKKTIWVQAAKHLYDIKLFILSSNLNRTYYVAVFFPTFDEESEEKFKG